VARPAELVDEAGVGQGDRGLLGQRLEDRRLGLAEGVGPGRFRSIAPRGVSPSNIGTAIADGRSRSAV
jgi:hypothetical protein